MATKIGKARRALKWRGCAAAESGRPLETNGACGFGRNQGLSRCGLLLHPLFIIRHRRLWGFKGAVPLQFQWTRKGRDRGKIMQGVNESSRGRDSGTVISFPYLSGIRFDWIINAPFRQFDHEKHRHFGCRGRGRGLLLENGRSHTQSHCRDEACDQHGVALERMEAHLRFATGLDVKAHDRRDLGPPSVMISTPRMLTSR